MALSRIKIGWFDAAGFGIVTCALVAAVWLTQLNPGSARAALADLRHRELALQTEHSRVQRTREQAQERHNEQLAEARSSGLLEPVGRINARLRSIRELATNHDWQDVQILPLYASEASDFTEQRFKVTAQAAFAEVLTMLRDFQRSERRADISHIALRPVNPDAALSGQHCSIEMTLDLYTITDPLEIDE